MVMGSGQAAGLVGAVIRIYATKTDTGDIQRCPDNGKVCYRDLATADSCAVELRAAQMDQEPYRCHSRRDHFHLATSRKRSHKDERQQQTAAFARVLLTIDGQGSTRDELLKATNWDPMQTKKFRKVLDAFARSRLIVCGVTRSL